jgi:prevent-host-death family protein
MHIANLHQAKTHLSALIAQALAGEDVIIARAGKPMVRLMPCSDENTPRLLGAWKQEGVWIDPDFDAPLPEWESEGLDTQPLS